MSKETRITVNGKPGVLLSKATYAELYPEAARHSEALASRGKGPKTDPKSVICTVQLDGEDRPRAFPASAVKEK